MGGKCGVICLGKNFIEGHCPWGNRPGGKYLGVIIWGAKVCGEVGLGGFHGGRLSGGQLSREN